MKKLFISQPMYGRTKKSIIFERNVIAKKAEAMLGEKVQVIDSYFDSGKDYNPLWQLAKSLESLSQADIAFFADDWKYYRGCRIEHKACEEYGIKILND